MKERLMLLIVSSLLFGAVFFVNLIAWSFEKRTAIRIPEDQILPQGFKGFEKSGTYRETFNDLNSAKYYYNSFDSTTGFAVYMDPTQCGPSPYPFRITDVHFYLYAPPPPSPPYHWPVAIRVNIRDSNQGDSCSGPGNVLCSEDFSVPSDSAHPLMMTLTLSKPCCLNQPFFLEIVYTEPRDPAHPHPSLLMDNHAYPPDTCDNWFILSNGTYVEWHDFWPSPPPGDAIIRAIGYINDAECVTTDTCWYWKADKPDQGFPAPSGMPDFDQYQFGSGQDSLALCGPAAAANCLWWFDAVPEGMSPPDLIRLLSTYFKCDPHFVGTYVDSMELGLDQYFIDNEFSLYEHTYFQPNFHEMEDSLEKSQDIILLLGFWWSEDGIEWWRDGGHFVTMAGVCSESLKIAISDAALDPAVGGWPGRVRPPAHAAAGTYPPEYHNDPQYVSHDMYQSILEPPFPSEGNPFWEIDYGWWIRGGYSSMNVPDIFQAFTRPAPKEGKYMYATEVEFAVMICPKASAVEGEEEGALTPKEFELHQNYPNPFNNETMIEFNLKKPAEITLGIYNILGQKVRTLAKGRIQPGSTSVSWDGKDEEGNELSSGIYFYQLKVGEVKETKRLALLK